MNKPIWKFPLPAVSARLNLPVGSKILSAMFQGSDYADEPSIVIYALVNTDNKRTKAFHVVCFNTGNGVPSDIEQTHTFLATIEANNGIVWHIWYEESKS